MNATYAGWPAPLDYSLALQNPPGAFFDSGLANGTVELDALQLPRARSGQMATVFRVQDHALMWAVRCFGFSSMQRDRRYAAISAFFQSHPSRYFVGFEYIQDGIRIESLTYPVVKMEWVDGDLLHVHLSKHRNDPRALNALAKAWIDLSRDLHRLKIAHGDLQHGNVLVTRDGELKLVDYDGIFVPQFAGRPATEIGHRNYQHPSRDVETFDENIDAFSIWVIFVSIIALARDASVWSALDYADDCLAFRREDFVEPSVSPTFERLRASSDRDVHDLAIFLESMLSHAPENLPPLEDRVRAVAVAAPVAGAGRPADEHRPDWIPHYQSRANHAGAEGGESVATAWHIEVLDAAPLERGALREPYGVPAEALDVDVDQPKKRSWIEWIGKHRGPVIGGTAAAATAGSYEVAHFAGFSIEQYTAVVCLTWILAGIIAAASRPAGPAAPG